MKNSQKSFIQLISALLVTSLSVMVAFAAQLTSMSDTMSSIKIGNPSNHAFVFTTPTGIGAGSTTLIFFATSTGNSEFTIPAALTFTDVDVNIGSPYVASATLASVPSGATWGVARISSSQLLLTNGSGAVTPGSIVYVRIGTNALHQSTGAFQVTNATTTGSKSISIAGGTSTPMADLGTTTVQLINDDTVSVNAVVQQSIAFSISANSIYYGNLSSGAARYASSTNTDGDSSEVVAHSLLIGTNAPSGYTITVLGQTLTSQQNANNTITHNGATPAASSAGSEQFGIYATKSGGVNGTIATPYVTASSFGYNASATTTATFASGSSSTNTETYALRYIANISALTEAGNYSASLVYVGTANY